MANTFQYDLHQSQQKEKDFEMVLNEYGFNTTNTQDKGLFPEYDILAWTNNTTSTYEVKYDDISSRTGNVAVEAYKLINGLKTPSGITSTKATYQVYSFPQDSNFYVISTTTLLKLILDQQYHKIIRGGDQGNVQLVLFKKEHFISHCSIL